MDDYTYDDQVIDANLGDRPDLAYDNEALDVLTELFDNADNNISDDILNGQTDRLSHGHTLPDSPPYSGSEAYSPDSNKLPSPSACSDLSNPSSGYIAGTPEPSRMNQQHQLHNHLLQQQQQLHHQQMQQHLHERQLIQQRLQQQAAMQNGGQLLVPQAALHMQRQQPVPMPQLLADNQVRPGDSPQQAYSPDQFSGASKKRKFISDSPPLTDAQLMQQQQMQQQLQQVKQEPVTLPHPVHPSPPQQCDFEQDPASQAIDISPSMLNGGSYQPIKWREFQKSAWCPMINGQGQRISAHTYRLDGDKGFNFSQIDKAFVCQKKNHFQITSCLSFTDAPQYVVSPEGPKPVEGFFMHFYGVKEEAPNQIIQVDQSQADRSKRKFDPVALHPNPEHSWKVTIGRLHFSDTTLNNMRKRGKPNPDQRYFLLVVGIFAHSQGKEYPVIQQCSEKLIVRASNPGQFQDSEAEPVKWQPGQTNNSVFHSGKVGINTDTPDEALVVAGNVKVMGTIMQPSDRRVKDDITKADTKEQLKNLQAISLYNYRYTEEFANAAGLDDPHTLETGVIAQELEVVIPEAVKTTTDVKLPNGEVIDNLKVVDKNRLFMESLGAVKELCNVTDSLEHKINYLERFNQKLKKLKRIGSMRSTASNESDLSRVTSISTVSHVTVHRKKKRDMCTSGLEAKDKEMQGQEGARGVCSNRFLQILIFVLVFVMVACVAVILAMLLIERSDAQENNDLMGSDAQAATDNPLNKGDPYRTTPYNAQASTPENWLMGPGCDDGSEYCDWQHCENHCPSFIAPGGFVNPNFTDSASTEASQQSYEIILGTTQPQGVGSEVHYSEPKQQKDEKRRKRSTGVENPAVALDIALTTPVPFDIDERRCLECEEGGYNYTYGVQVSASFPGTNANLNIRPREGKDTKKWNYVALCEVPSEPATKACIDTSSNVDQLFNVTPEYNFTPQQIHSYPQGNDFTVEVGKYFKNVAVFRLSDYHYETNEELCKSELSQNVVEFRIWFIRVCYITPASKGSLLHILELNTDGEKSHPGLAQPTGGTNLDLDINEKPV